MHHPEDEHTPRMRSHMRQHVRELTGETETAGLELASLVRWLGNLYENAEVPPGGSAELSGPRWGLMLRLMAAEQHGGADGLTPTHLSHFQNVSKNTISALLRGLEEQGLIQRTLDAEDRRLFRIRLTDHGRQVVQKEAPQRIRYLNKLASGISPEEQDLLINLLAKLYRSISANCGQQKDNPFFALFVDKEQPR